VVICLEQGADLHMAQPMPLPLTVSCISEIQIGFAFLVLAQLGSPGKRAVKRECVCKSTCAITICIPQKQKSATEKYLQRAPIRISADSKTANIAHIFKI